MIIDEFISADRSQKLPRALKEVAFADGLWPWMQVARRRLDAVAGKQLSLLLPQAIFDLEQVLLGRWSRFAAPSLVLEMKIAEMQGDLQGSTPRKRYLSFIDRLFGDPIRLRAFFEEYHKLASFLEKFLVLWVESTSEFLLRLERDYALLEKSFNQSEPLGKVSGLSLSLSDPHYGGRSVCIVKFEAGKEIVYKPKDLGIAFEFYNLIEALNDRGLSPRLGSYKIVPREGYGWEEKVAPRPCQNLEEVRRYFERSGMLLCLMYLLEGTDAHYENIIASGENPFLIDLETLFHASLITVGARKELKKFSHTVLRTGLLPHFELIPQQGKGHDISGLGNDEDYAYNVETWKKVNTDEMQLATETVYQESSSHQVVCEGKREPASRYVEEIALGFRKAYQLVKENRSLFLESGHFIDRLAQHPVRIVVRPTRFYGYLAHQLSAPSLLLDEEKWEHTLLRLHDLLRTEKKERFEPLVQEERKSLLQGDIPCFSTYPRKKDLFAQKRLLLENCIDGLPFDEVCNKMREMNETDLELQESFIRHAFYATTASLHGSETEIPQASAATPKSETNKTTIIDTVYKIAQKILDSAYHLKDGNLVWLSLTSNPALERLSFGMVDNSLFSGKTGIALFFAALSAYSKEKKWKEIALQCVQELRADIRKGRAATIVSDYGIGGMAGAGGLIYSLCVIAKLLNAPELIEEAKELALSVPQGIEADCNFDIIFGSAGLILALLTLWKSAGDPQFLRCAEQAGKHLCAHLCTQKSGAAWLTAGELPLLGFSHGAAGIAYALFQLAEASRQPDFARAAAQALAYERSLFCPQNQNWPCFHSHDYFTFRSHWCHGAIGIGFSRLGLPDAFRDSAALEEIRYALVKAQKDLLVGERFGLCCGGFGRFELLLETSRLFPNLVPRASVEAALSALLTSYEQPTASQGPNHISQQPGFMQGIAGIGYSLLRYLDKNQELPQVLLIAS